MGKSKEPLEDRQRENHERKIAQSLGLTLEEYRQCETDEQPDESENLPTSLNIYFLEGSSKAVLKKLGIEIGDFVSTGPI